MSYVLFDFDTLTDGEALTTDNSGASIVNEAGGTITAEADVAVHGPVGALFTSSGYTICRFNLPGNSSLVSMCVGLKNTGTPGFTGLQIRNSGGGTNLGVALSSSGELSINQTTGFTPTQNVGYQLAIEADLSAGTADWTIYDAGGVQLDSGSVTFTSSLDPVVSVDVGAFQAGHSIGWDALQFNVGSLTPISPLVDSPPEGSVTETWTATGSAVGNAPEIPPAEGTSTESWGAAASATGSAPDVPAPVGSVVTSWAAASSATGAAPSIPAATGVATTSWSADVTAIGLSPKPGIDIDIAVSTIPARWSVGSPVRNPTTGGALVGDPQVAGDLTH